ncbi:MAG TPA: HAMP domain-containing protein, partial [Myxococcales bacterium]|nr:HAMP domain-containing protein [Myxococcales bacterium]
MRLSIRTQIVLLVSLLLLAAMGIYLVLATRLFTADKLSFLYDYDAQLASTLADEVQASLHGTVDKLLFFGAEQAELAIQPGMTEDRPARSLFADDPDLLGVEAWDKTGDGFSLAYHYEFKERLQSIRLDVPALEEARRRSPMDVKLVQSRGIVLQNASLPPALPLLRLFVLSHDATRVVVADIRPARLLPAFSHAPQHSRVYLVDARGTVLVHSDESLVLQHADFSQSGAVKPALEAVDTGGVHEFDTPEGVWLGAWATVHPGRITVILEEPKEEATAAVRDLARRSVLFAVAVLLVALVLSVFFARRVSDPLRGLQEKMESISRGDFGIEVDVPSGNEIGALAAAFNRMSRELGARERALLETNQQLIQSEKLSALGEMSAGLAHEVKNPMVGICGFSELGAHVETLEEAREYFALINADAQRANEILQNLLTFARPEAAALTALDVNETVRGAVRLVAH